MLNKEQLEIVKNENDNILVIAGPGSGKTRVLVYKMAHILENSKDSFKAACLTFSNEAAKHMKDELKKLLPANKMRRLFVGNFHQYGQYLLRNYGHLVGVSRKFTVMSPDQSLEILKESLLSVGLTVSDTRKLIDNISRYRNGVNYPKPEELGEFSSQFVSIMKSYEVLKRERALIDFDDLIILSIDLLKKNPHLQILVRQVYKYIFVDELQDTSLLQLELLKIIFDENNGRILGVADQDQILYEWRDARVRTIKDFENEFNAKVKRLVLNYRSPQEILDVANTLIKHNDDRFDSNLVSTVKDREGVVVVHSAQFPIDEANFVVDNIVESISNGHRFGDHVVLFREFWMAIDVKDALSKRNIPYVHIGSKEVSKSSITNFLKATIYLASGSEYGRKQLVKSMEDLAEEVDTDIIDPEQLIKIINETSKLPPSRFVDTLLMKIGLRKIVEGTELAKRLEVATKVIREAFNDGISSYNSLSDAITMEWERLEAKVLKQENSVKVMTIHRSKGLEFPVVYIIHFEEGNIPRIRKDSTPNFPEERRLLYVAITRAKEKVIITHSEFKKNNNFNIRSTSSRFLEEISSCKMLKD